jgi:predicted nucleic acid-binding protein
MARIVIDASATLAWLFDEEDTNARVRPILDSSELVAPWLWRLEVANAILVRERRKLLAETLASRLLQALDDLKIDLVGEPADRTVVELAKSARPYQLCAYDAVYVDLAIRLRLPLFTRDNNMRAAAKRAGVGLIGNGAS